MTAIPVRAFKLQFVIQQRQQEGIPTFSRNPSTVHELLMYQTANVPNDLHLTFDNLNRNEFFEHPRVRLGLRAFTKLEREPLPIGCEVAAH